MSSVASTGEMPTADDVSAPPPPDYRRWLWADRLLVVLPTAFLIFMGWRRRWIGDDGLIFVRVVRQLLAGHGPVYNVGERAETNTSTLWTYLLTALSWVSGADPAKVAVYTGLVLTGAGIALAIDGSRRVWRTTHHGVLIPAGVLVVLALPPFWNFATSGLDTGLGFFWVGLLWWLLVRTRIQMRTTETVRARGGLLTSIVAGVGFLVRPELALVAAVFMVALLITLRPANRLKALGLVAAFAALPVAYELFRAAYYGILVPLPGVAKEAGTSDWRRGADYVLDTVRPYWLLVPVLVLLALLVLTMRRSPADRATQTDRLLVAAPLVAAVLLTAYVVRVGGDFMHARMMLVPILLALLPVLVLPGRVLTYVGVVVLAAWAGWCMVSPRPDVPTAAFPTGNSHGFVDERQYWTFITATAHPTSAAPYVRALGKDQLVAKARAIAATTGHGVLIVQSGYNQFSYLPLRPGLPWRVVLVYGTLGTGGASTSLDEAAFDPEGLAYPLAAHSALARRGRPGHDKEYPLADIVADFADPSARLAGLDPEVLAAARNQLRCPAVTQLNLATRAPLTLSRAWNNVWHSISATEKRIPSNPSASHPC